MRICILCGKDHPKGTPCDWSQADPILTGKITIPAKQEESVKIEQPKRGRPPKWTITKN